MAFKKIIPLLTTVEAAYLKECDLDAALGRMAKELDDLVEEREDLGYILLELESLHKEVWLLYQRFFFLPPRGSSYSLCLTCSQIITMGMDFFESWG